MSITRIIPRLDIKGPNLVKGIHLEGLRVLGKPEEFAKHYYDSGADELMLQDVVASLYERNSLDHIISKIAENIFIPLTVGGGLRTIEDIQRVLRFGADKVAINTGAIKNPSFISEAANKFGSSTIVVAIEAIKESNGQYLAYVDNGRDYTGIDAIEWAKKVEELGAGEIILTSVDKEGTGEGFDIDLVQQVTESASIPVICHGGAGKRQDIEKALSIGKAHSVAITSILHYGYINSHDTVSASDTEGNIEFLKKNKSFHNFEVTTIPEIKDYLVQQNIECRL